MDFKTYVENHAYARGEEAKAELAKLTKKFPEYKNPAQYAKNFPVVYGRYQKRLKLAAAKPRASKQQTKKAA